MQRDVLAAASDSPVEYVDCTATPGHAACQVQAKGFPYLAECTGTDCKVVTYGLLTAAQLAQRAQSK